MCSQQRRRPLVHLTLSKPRPLRYPAQNNQRLMRHLFRKTPLHLVCQNPRYTTSTNEVNSIREHHRSSSFLAAMQLYVLVNQLEYTIPRIQSRGSPSKFIDLPESNNPSSPFLVRQTRFQQVPQRFAHLRHAGQSRFHPVDRAQKMLQLASHLRSPQVS